MKKFNCGSYSLDRGEVSSIIVIGLIQSDCSWLRGYEGHGSRHDVELEEILFHDDPHHVPAYLLYGEETLKNRFGQDGITFPSKMNTSNVQIDIYEETSVQCRSTQKTMDTGDEMLRKRFTKMFKFRHKI